MRFKTLHSLPLQHTAVIELLKNKIHEYFETKWKKNVWNESVIWFSDSFNQVNMAIFRVMEQKTLYDKYRSQA